MKKFTSLLMLLAMFAGASWGQDTETIQVSTDVASPEHVYTMKSGNGYWMNSTTGPTSTAGNAAQFAFYSVEGTENACKIYCVTSQKWLSYTKADSYSGITGFVSLIDAQESAEAWHYEIQDGKGNLGNVYCFAPFNNSGVAANYMNWFKGVGADNPLDNTNITVGLWQDNATADNGSCWIVQEVITGLVTTVDGIKTGRIYTIKSSRNAITWNGSDANCVGAALDASNQNHQFVAVKMAGSNDRFYFFNVGAGKFMSKSSNNASLTDACQVYWTVKASGDDAWPLMLDSEDGNHFNFGGSGQITIDGWSTADAGNKLQITGVGVAEATLLETIQKKIVAHVQQEYEAWEAAISVGSGFGQYTVNSDALAAAKAALQNAADEAAALAAKQQCMNAYTLNGPVAGNYYRIKSTTRGTYMGLDGYTLNVKNKSVTDETTYDNDPTFIWQCVQDGEQYYLKNVYSGLYPQYVPAGGDKTTVIGTSKDYAFTYGLHAAPTSTAAAQWNIMFGGRQVNVETNGNVNYWTGDNAHHYIYEVSTSEEDLAQMCADWYKANPYTAPAKIELAEDAYKVISPSEFGNPVDINSAIDKLSLSADDATQEKVHQLFQNIISEASAVNAYVNAVNSYGALLSVVYETKAAEWATIILPVNWSKPEGWTRYSCAATEGNILTLAEVGDGVNKNTPFIIKVGEAQQGKKYQFIGYNTGAATTNQTAGLLTGVLEDNATVPVGSYILSKYNDKMGFYRVAEGTSYDAAKNKCYLTLPAAAARYAALFFEGDTETGIDGISDTEAKQGNGVIYNMSGQRMNKMQKGLNIVNGKIILK